MTALDVMVPRGALRVRRDDVYETPAEAVAALLRVEDVPPVVWEPACGPGAIARVLRAHGRRVIATDLLDHASPDQDAIRWDFLLERSAPPGCDCIVTNPPFKLAGKFVEHALRLCPRVIMFLRLDFIEGARRSSILDCGRLARIYVFADRVPMMHRVGYQGRQLDKSRICFAWFVWDRNHHGDAALRRIWSAPREERRP
jgi:hypothetical protein